MTYVVAILTFNEECNIRACLESVPDGVKTFVIDSYSTDQTVGIARSFGAVILERTFDNYASQRNFAIEVLGKNSNWIFMLDADERLTPELHEEILRIIKKDTGNQNLFRIRRKDYFMGKWIKRSSGYPTWFGRLVRNKGVTIERPINEEFLTDGEIGFLENHILHYPFNKGLDHWLKRHVQYANMEADLLLKRGERPSLNVKRLLYDPAYTRSLVKHFVYGLPMRPLIVFMLFYFVRYGFLDGKAGFNFARLKYTYEIMIDAQLAYKRYKRRE